eukprot:7847929-Karenia_brevis.AAC.1
MKSMGNCHIAWASKHSGGIYHIIWASATQVSFNHIAWAFGAQHRLQPHSMVMYHVVRAFST